MVDSDRVVESGEIYTHEEHGAVDVTGIWQGANRVAASRNMDEADLIIVRYCSENGIDRVDTLDETLEAIE